MTENKKLILLKKLKKVSDMYRISTNEQKLRLFEASSFLIEELFDCGYPRIVCESLLMFSSEFVWKEHLDDAEIKEVFVD